jgi:hypothetical protein
LLRVSFLTSSSSPSYFDRGCGEDAAVLPVTLDIAKGVGDVVGGELDNMVDDDRILMSDKGKMVRVSQ